MDVISLTDFLGQLSAYPVLAVIVILVFGVTIISGATDAPNAIATTVSTRCMSPNAAIAMAAVFNFIGLVVMTWVFHATAVAGTMFGMVNFAGDTTAALYALMAAMIAAILWGVVCWLLGIPASKSHSLIAGISGAAIAINGLAGIVPEKWVNVIYGMAFSLIASFIIAWIVVKITKVVLARAERRAANRGLQGVQVVLAAILAFLHGAQDGQKFMSIALMGIAFAFGMDDASGAGFPIWLMIACSLCMALGTAVGGKRIIKSVAMDMVSLERYQGVSASISTCLTLLIATLTGMPVSTSHANTASIMGVGAEKSIGSVKWGVAGGMVGAWILTFPCCGIIGFLLTQLTLLIF